MEQLKLIAELESEEKNLAFKMINTFMTKKKFKDFFQKMWLLYKKQKPGLAGLKHE
ncbi:hypothetical protein U3A58_04260 [Algoriphagus sp. C2-6-M1]|uniref:hypothetical protein n=1 Tax=Algoriphagus persicinus TaxID=3108754 RepID=UPI002B38D4E2|nr:hypothetical protein [Algoriphagus sp. C2-6-M1]MEB2779596.1 hypothetical protein [Algoriphagus sp. C2-6-M1]